MAVCGLSIYLGSYESCKTLEQNLSFMSALKSAFHLTDLSFFSCHHVPTNGVAPFSAYQHTHTTHNSSISSEKGLTLEMSALKLFRVANLCEQLMLLPRY